MVRQSIFHNSKACDKIKADMISPVRGRFNFITEASLTTITMRMP